MSEPRKVKVATVFVDDLKDLIEALRHSQNVIRKVSAIIPACKDVADGNEQVLSKWRDW